MPAHRADQQGRHAARRAVSDGHGMLLWRKRQITVGLAQQWKMLAPVHHVEACRQAGLAYQAAGQRSRPVHDKRKDGVQAQR